MHTDLDILHREEYIEILKNIIDGVSAGKKSSVFAIDGKWGIGKSFIIDKLHKEIDKSKYVVFNYNCWQYDYYEEPLVAIISNIQNNIEYFSKYYSKDFKEEYKAVKGMDTLYDSLNSIIDKLSGINFKELGKNALGANKKYDKNNNFNNIINEIQKCLENITSTIPIIFIIDELDRCMPEYAIKILERIHHIFHGFENVIVLLSVDRTQLDYSIRKIFGDNTDIDGYLKKFVDFTIRIDNGSMTDNWEKKFSEDFFSGFSVSDINFIKSEIKPYLSLLNIREIEKVFNKINVINSSIKVIDKYGFDDIICIFEIVYAIANEKFKYKNKLDWIKGNMTVNQGYYFKSDNITAFNNNENHELDGKIKEFYSFIENKHKLSIYETPTKEFYLKYQKNCIWYGLFYYKVFGDIPYKVRCDYGSDMFPQDCFKRYLEIVEYIDKMYKLF